jgi:hypothetical protein
LGRTVVVHDEPDDRRGADAGGDQAPADRDGRTGVGPNIGVPGDETPREPQAGL